MIVITYNIHKHHLTDKFFDLFQKKQADVVLLQEVRMPSVADIINRASRYEFHFANFGELVILSRYPLENVACRELPYMDLTLRSRIRVSISADIKTDKDTIRIHNVQLDTRLNFPDRLAQLSPILEDRAPITIIGGDFNTVPLKFLSGIVPKGFESQKKLLDNHLKNTNFVNSESSPQRTFRTFPWSLDAIYSRGMASLDAGVHKDIKYSDHFPVWAKFQV